MKLVVFLSFLLALAGCRPEHENTDYSELDKSQITLELEDSDSGSCEALKTQEDCEAALSCQPIFESAGGDSLDYISCIDYPEEGDEADSDEEQVTLGGEGSNESGGTVDDSADTNGDAEEHNDCNYDLYKCKGKYDDDDSSDDDRASDDDDSNDDDERRGRFLHLFKKWKKKFKVAVCHVPDGDPEKAHTICIAIQGSFFGAFFNCKF